MPAKISQEEREKQIKQLCEGTLYSFAGWDGEYKNNNSKFICRCEKHGEWSVRVDKFIRGSRCSVCSGKKHLSQEEREQQIKQLCEGTTYSFAGWDGEYKNSYSKFICRCEKHGEWSTSVNSFINKGMRCPSCGGTKHLSQEECEKQIKQLCEGTIYSFVGWDGEYKNRRSKFICRCEKHGGWSIRVDSFINSSSRCASCSNNRLFLQEEREKQIKQLCEGTIYSFAGWDGEYKNSDSKFICRCEKHGEWSVSVNNFIRGTRCSGCAEYGYNMAKLGSLYCLRSECGQFVKIGITNKVKQRFTQLKRKTPFDFHLIELFTHEDGSKAREWEKLFHQSFESANLTDFDGCTEWLKWTPEIQGWFRFLK